MLYKKDFNLIVIYCCGKEKLKHKELRKGGVKWWWQNWASKRRKTIDFLRFQLLHLLTDTMRTKNSQSYISIQRILHKYKRYLWTKKKYFSIHWNSEIRFTWNSCLHHHKDLCFHSMVTKHTKKPACMYKVGLNEKKGHIFPLI